MIELATNHKVGLPVANPILLAGGSIGYGEAVHPALNLSKLGAVTVGPLMLHSRAGSTPPRLKEVEGGFLLNTGLQNRGLDATIRTFARLWTRIGCPVIVQVSETNLRAIARIAQRLNEISTLAGIELLVSADIEQQALRQLIRNIVGNCDLPLLVKLPLYRAAELAEPCISEDASGLVIGSAFMPMADNESVHENPPVLSNLYGPVVFPKMLETLQQVSQMGLGCSLIACGGIYTTQQVQQALQIGAQAVQIDSAIWAEPGLPGYLLSQVERKRVKNVSGKR